MSARQEPARSYPVAVIVESAASIPFGLRGRALHPGFNRSTILRTAAAGHGDSMWPLRKARPEADLPVSAPSAVGFNDDPFGYHPMEKRNLASLRVLFTTMPVLLLSACGGSDERLVDQYKLRSTVYVGEQSGPQGEGSDGWLEQCVYVYVVTIVDSEQGPPLPHDFKILSVAISREKSGTVVWQGAPDLLGSYFESPSRFRGWSRGCSAGFATEEKLKLKIRVAGDGEEDEIETSTSVITGNS